MFCQTLFQKKEKHHFIKKINFHITMTEAGPAPHEARPPWENYLRWCLRFYITDMRNYSNFATTLNILSQMKTPMKYLNLNIYSF